MTRALALIVAIVVVLVTTRTPSDAASAQVNAFSATSVGNLVFTLSGLSPAQASAPVTYGFSLTFRTSPTAGAIITVTAPTMVGAASTIPATAFLAQCTAVSDLSGAFTSSGNVRLSGSAVTCGTLRTSVSETLTFNVTLTLDGSADAFSSIPSDTYANGTLTVGANLP